MKFSVIIPAYNAAATIDRTVKSALEQSRPPFEILVLDDGSTDDTSERLRRYHPRVTNFHQPNGGLSRARNFLCSKASGDVIAMLDADDLWHPRYLEIQEQILTAYPTAVASITRNQPFRREEEVNWSKVPDDIALDRRLLSPVEFLREYNDQVINFLPSFCCLPKRTVEVMGEEPFPGELRGTGDFFAFNALALHGPVAVFDKPLGAYRLTAGSLSSSRVRIMGEMLEADGLLIKRTGMSRSPFLAPTYFNASASLHRRYGKYLMGDGRLAEARRSIVGAMKIPAGVISLAKSIGLYFATLLPKSIQPHWPAPDRDAKVH